MTPWRESRSIPGRHDGAVRSGSCASTQAVRERARHFPPKGCSPRAEAGAALQRVKGSGAYLGTMPVFEFLVPTAVRSGEGRNVR